MTVLTSVVMKEESDWLKRIFINEIDKSVKSDFILFKLNKKGY